MEIKEQVQFRLFIFLVIATLSISLQAQSYSIFQGDTINRVDSNGLKYGEWIEGDVAPDSILIDFNPEFTIGFSRGIYSIVHIPDSLIISLDTTRKSLETKHIWTYVMYGSKFVEYYSLEDGWWEYYGFNKKYQPVLTDKLLHKGGELKKHVSYQNGVLQTIVHFDSLDSQHTYQSSNIYPYSESTSYFGNLIYYPDEYVSYTLESGEMPLTLVAVHPDCDTSSLQIHIHSESSILIDSISSHPQKLSFLLNRRPFTARELSPDSTYELGIIYCPSVCRTGSYIQNTVVLHSSTHRIEHCVIPTKTKCYDLWYLNLSVTPYKINLQKNKSHLVIGMASLYSQYPSCHRVELWSEGGLCYYSQDIVSKSRMCFIEFTSSEIDISNCPAGNYVLKLLDADGAEYLSQPIVIEE